MLWVTHKRIILEICKEFQLSNVETNRFIEGVIAPDKWKDYPHHHSKSRTIRDRLLKARGLFLHDDVLNAYYHLGVAFHYIQDAYTSFVWRSNNFVKGQEWHKKYEQWIDEAYFVRDLEKLVITAFKEDRKQREYYLKLLRFQSSKIDGKEDTLQLSTFNNGRRSREGSEWGKPVVDLNLAFHICLIVAKSVLGSKTYPRLQGELYKVLTEYEILLKEAENKISIEIVESILKRDKAKKAKGLFSFISTGIISRFHSMRAKSKYKQYTEQKHLQRVAKAYDENIYAKTRPYIDWYNITLPPINATKVQKELLSIQEALKYFNKESVFQDILQKRNLIYQIDNQNFVRKSELKTLAN